MALGAAPHGLEDAAVARGERVLQAGQGPAAGRMAVHPPHQATQALGAWAHEVPHTLFLLWSCRGLRTGLGTGLEGRRGDVDPLQEGREEAVALVELAEAVLADERRQGCALVHGHPQQALKVPDEDALSRGYFVGASARDAAGDAAETP